MSYERRPREMHKATCGDCGNECQVPFEPRGDKPVYCNECFQKHKPQGGGEVVTEAAVTTEVQETTDHEKCTKQHVATVATSVKYHSSQKRTDLFIARNASQIIEEIKARLYFHILWTK